MKRDDEKKAMDEQLAAEQAGLAGKQDTGKPQPGQGGADGNKQDDALPGAPTQIAPHAPLSPEEQEALRSRRPINLPPDENNPQPQEPTGAVSTLGQPTHRQPVPRDQRGDHEPPVKRNS